MKKLVILNYLLAAIFLMSGGAKLAGLEFEVSAFERWGYPLWFMYFTGFAEVSGGVALAFDLLKKYAAPALSLLMIGALATHILHQEWPMLVIALGIIIGCSYLTHSLWKTSNQAA